MLGPVLRGEHICLEPAREEFLSTFIRWFADMEITRYLLIRLPMSLKQEQEWFDNMTRDRGSVHWTITLDSEPIGVTGVHDIDWINRGAGTGTLLGARSEWGKGYASEAVRLRTEFAFNELHLHRLETHSFAVNKGMHKALERSGYRRIGTRTEAYFREGQWHDAYSFEVLKNDWTAAQPTARHS